jgi:hypothetical protein
MTQAQRQQKPINLDAVFEALQRPLALVDSPERRADLQRFIESARLHLERAIFDLLSDAVATINEAGGGARARLEYQAGALNLVVEPTAEADNAGGDAEPAFNIEGDMEKVTIRIPAELKDLISHAANLGGVSMNSWYVRELARTISRQVRDQIREETRQNRPETRRGRRGGQSLRGFVGD